MLHKPEFVESNGVIAEVIRTARVKSADIRVEDGAVSVVIPLNLCDARISQLLHDKRQWIQQKIWLHREAMPVGIKEFVSGESFSYLGRNYRLKVRRGKFMPMKLQQGRLEITVPGGKKDALLIRAELVRWYRSHAEIKLKEKVDRYAPMIQVKPEGIGIKTFKSRWGSCSVRGKVDFNWKIIMAPNRVVDYVVVHELCHLKQHDHSPKFWKQVERFVPDYLESKSWLKQHSDRLCI